MAPPQPPPAPRPPPRYAPDEPLPPPRALLAASLARTRARFRVLVAVTIACWFPAVAALVALSAARDAPGRAASAALFLLGLAAAVWAAGFTLAALLAAASREGGSAGEALRAGRRAAWRTGLAATLAAAAVAGGTLLLLLPGIAFAAWFALVPFAAREGASGMDALTRSHRLVQGRGSAVLLRLLPAAAAVAALLVVPPAAPALAMLLLPFAAAHASVVHEAIRATRAEPAAGPARAWKAGVLAVVAAGWLAVPAALLLVAGPPSPAAEILRLGLRAVTGDLDAPDSLAAMPGAPAPGAGAAPDAWGLALDRIRGSWRGAPAGGGEEWTFVFAGAREIEIRGPRGERLRGAPAARWDLGAERGGPRVLRGGNLLDLRIAEASDPDARGKVALGSFWFDGRTLRVCLGEPGGRRRTSEFETAGGITCWALRRAGGGGPELEVDSALER
ncbi:MAG TPA: hypothetical protein VLS93_04390 [Anaeromyxobacteraceae bacterium]|nr:hypothetical protein [Anaeromyxobacteraceae bacterium]